MIDRLALNMVTYNEAHRILATLEHAAPLVDEMVIVDQSSPDGTADICRDFGATVLTDVHHGFCEPSRQMNLDATQSEWVLVLDADNTVSDELQAELRTLDQHRQNRVRCGSRINGIVMGVSEPIYRVIRKDDFYCKPQIHTCPLPKNPICVSQIYRPRYVGIWDDKTWTELLIGLESYEVQGRTDLPQLHLARTHGVTGPELDQMSHAELAALGFVEAA